MKRTPSWARRGTAGALLALAAAVPALPQGFPPAPVIVSEILERPVVERVNLVGTAHARRVSQVASETEGKVVARFLEPGQSVQRGDALLRLANDELVAAMEQAEAELRLQTFRREHTARLRQSDAISEDAAIATEADFARARAAWQDLTDRIDNLTVRAPFDGSLVESLVEIGEWVGRGESVAHVVATDTARVYVDVPERYVDRVQRGDVAQVRFTALGTDSISASVVAVLDQGYAETRNVPVIVEFLNPGRRVRGGMSASVTLSIEPTGEDLLVHKDAVVTGARGSHIFVVDGDNAAMRPITTGLAYQGFVAVTGEALRPGDLAIVRGNERLRDGQAVRVVRKLQ